MLDHAIAEGFVPADQRALFVVEKDPEKILDALARYEFPVLGRKWVDEAAR